MAEAWTEGKVDASVVLWEARTWVCELQSPEGEVVARLGSASLTSLELPRWKAAHPNPSLRVISRGSRDKCL